MTAPRIFVVEDRDSLRKFLCKALEREGYSLISAASGKQAIGMIETETYDLLLTDLKLPGATGIEILAASREKHPRIPVVVLTAFGSVQTAVEAMKLGASDFLEKPLEIDDLYALARSLTHQRGKGNEGEEDKIFQVLGGPPIVGSHPKLKAALRLLSKVATTESTVLLTGESGTGKELFARSLHGLSARSKGPFVAVNCAAIPHNLMENELFGHEKGAFTGAHGRQAGRFELAARGTLFLDEVGELDLAVQGKVLRVLEERCFERVGSGKPIRADVRIVAATNRDLATMVEEGHFREDLFFRLDVFPIELPPLRDRESDVPALARHLLDRAAERLGLPVPAMEPGALDLLQELPWPGNVRQLANVLERALILAEKDSLGANDLREVLRPGTTKSPEESIRQALLNCRGDKKSAAASLGMSYRNLQRKIRQFDLEGFPHYRDG